MNVRKGIVYFISAICALIIIFYFITDERLHLATKLIIFAIITIIALMVVIWVQKANKRNFPIKPEYLLMILEIAAAALILVAIIFWNDLQGGEDSPSTVELKPNIYFLDKVDSTPIPTPVPTSIPTQTPIATPFSIPALTTPSPSPTAAFSQETIDTFDAGYRNYVSNNFDDAYKLLHKAAKDGYPKAQLYLAFCYQEGKGTGVNSYAAFDWFYRAAENGLDVAQYNLGYCYHTGFGIRKNDESAFEWFQKAADQNNELGLLWTGYCYHYGVGVSQDYEKAEEYYTAAIALGNRNAQDRLDQLRRDRGF